MLGTLMTVLFLLARMVGKFGTGLFRDEHLHYRVYQPLPWYIRNNSRYRRSSRVNEGGARRSSINSSKGITQPLSEEKKGFTEANSERAAVTIQTQYRRYQQRKNEGRNS
ncbi:uncharacterized protein LOC119954159 isoform X2 [Scyliorhinus canicula]|uniref:uncharacterized protein LOC119954159 isoform X2 n=1 Tax=Scyliorhinus canicula TaxID=7830 RepID=UPI0018F3B403|nr:uncharacterized protein LOC119954159 isoform X2 [Scyliorhinus canicula]